MNNQPQNSFASQANAAAPGSYYPAPTQDQFQNPNPTPTPAPTQGGGGNWFTHLLPTIGGLAGGALGTLTDVFDGPLGTIGGSAGGSALGQGLENALEGKQVIQGNDLTAGLEGGIGAGVGGLAGKALGGIGGALAGRAGNLEGAAAANTAKDAEVAAAQATRNNFSGAGSSGVRAANNLKDNQSLLESWGVDHTNPQAMQNASKGGLFMNDIDEAALKAGNPIPTNKLISPHEIASASPLELNRLTSSGIIDENGGVASSLSPIQINKYAQDLNGQMRDVQATMQNAKEVGQYSQAQAAQSDLAALTKRYNEVQKLASSPEVDASIKARVISPDEKQSLVDQYGQQQADHIENAVNSAQSHTDLVKAKLPFAQMNTLSKLALRDAQDSASTRAVAGTKMDVNGDGVADPVVNPVTLASDVASSPTLTGKALAIGKHVADNPKIMDTLSRVGKMGDNINIGNTGKAIQSPAVMAGTAAGLIPTLGSGPVAPGTNGTMGGAMQNNNQMGPGNDPTSMANILSHFLDMQGLNPSLTGALAPQIASLAPLVTKQKLAADAVQQLQPSFANAGGAQGTGGILSEISSLIPGTAAHTFNQNRAAAAQALAASMGISPQEAMGYLPGLMQNGATAGMNQGAANGFAAQLGG
jgi:hypothetical protein